MKTWRMAEMVILGLVLATLAAWFFQVGETISGLLTVFAVGVMVIDIWRTSREF